MQLHIRKSKSKFARQVLTAGVGAEQREGALRGGAGNPREWGRCDLTVKRLDLRIFPQAVP